MSWKDLFRKKGEDTEMLVPLSNDKEFLELNIEDKDILEEIVVEENNDNYISTQEESEETITLDYQDTVGEIIAYASSSQPSSVNSNFIVQQTTVKRGVKIF